MAVEPAPRRIELDPEKPAIALPAAVVSELCRHAVETYPEECCGLVTGTSEQPYRTVYRCANVMNRMHASDPQAFARDARQAYYMSEVEYLSAQQDAEAKGESVSAIYHSHVDAGAYLSEDDLRFADHVLFPFPNAAQIVLGTGENGVRVSAVFLRDPQSGAFIGHPLAVRE